MKVEAGAKPATREARLQLDNTCGGGLGGIELPNFYLCCRQCDKRQAPVWICPKDLLRRLRRGFVFTTLELAQGDGEQWGKGHRIKRTEAQRTFAPLDTAIRIAGIDHHNTAKGVGEHARWT